MFARDRCRQCGEPLTNAVSRRFGIGPICRGRMTDEELTEALAAQRPDYIPPERRPSTTARLNNHHARAAAQAPTPDQICARHGGLAHRCAHCREENDPARMAARILYDIRRERKIMRDAGDPPDSRAATPTGLNYPARRELPPLPPVRDRHHPPAPAPPAGPEQLELL